MEKEVTAQQLYDELFFEMVRRSQEKGTAYPDEIDVFAAFVKSCQKAIVDGEAPPDFMDEVNEVVPFKVREVAEQKRKEEVDRALRQGTILDLNALLK